MAATDFRFKSSVEWLQKHREKATHGQYSVLDKRGYFRSLVEVHGAVGLTGLGRRSRLTSTLGLIVMVQEPSNPDMQPTHWDITHIRRSGCGSWTQAEANADMNHNGDQEVFCR
jgi:hypothetical protein